MKNFRTRKGPFSERPYYEDAEIESICADALRDVGLLPAHPEPIRIDRFIEKRFNVVPSYEKLPAGVMGLTRFGKDGVRDVVVDESLDQDETSSAQRRVRTTLAHEAGHCLLHAHLFVLSAKPQSLFGDFSEPERPKILCRGEAIGNSSSRYSGQWWEFHANRAIGALLLPQALATQALQEFMAKSQAGFKFFDYDQLEEASRRLSKAFDVNPAVGRIRIGQLFPIDTRQQLVL
jgi:hypothetical protein